MRRYWSIPIQREYMESIATKLHIGKPSDWGKINVNEMGEEGRYILGRYSGSMFKALSFIYPGYYVLGYLSGVEVQWNAEWFPQNQKKGFWTDHLNHKKMLEQIALKLNITSPKDWKIVTVRVFRDLGGASLLRQYGSILEALKAIYPGTNNYLIILVRN